MGSGIDGEPLGPYPGKSVQMLPGCVSFAGGSLKALCSIEQCFAVCLWSEVPGRLTGVF